MYHVQHLFEICVVLVGGAGNALIYWLVGRHVSARIDAGFLKVSKEVAQQIDDGLQGISKRNGELLAQFQSTILDDFSSHIQTAKNQLTGMSRRVCIKCQRMKTKFEETPEGALCEGCGGKV